MKVLIFGASGFLGRALLPRLLNDGRVVQVTAITHKAPLGLSLDTPKLDCLTIDDFFNPEGSAGRKSFDVVICLCGQGYSQTTNEVAIKNSNLDTPIRIIDYCRTVGTGHIILASSINARLASNKYSNKYSSYKKMVEDYLSVSGLPYTIFRPALIFGHGDAGMSRLVRHIQKFKLVPVFGDGQKLEQPIHVDETAAFFCKATFSAPANDIFEIGGLKAMTYDEMLLKIALAMRHRVSLLHIPIKPLLMALSFVERHGLGLPINSEQLLHIDTHLDIDNSLALRRYDVILRPFEELLLASYGVQIAEAIKSSGICQK
jgi:NADH dehydrogenase